MKRGNWSERSIASELLGWLKLLLAEDIPPEALKSGDRKRIIPPLHGALLKNKQDVHLFERLVFLSRTGKRRPARIAARRQTTQCAAAGLARTRGRCRRAQRTLPPP